MSTKVVPPVAWRPRPPSPVVVMVVPPSLIARAVPEAGSALSLTRGPQSHGCLDAYSRPRWCGSARLASSQAACTNWTPTSTSFAEGPLNAVPYLVKRSDKTRTASSAPHSPPPDNMVCMAPSAALNAATTLSTSSFSSDLFPSTTRLRVRSIDNTYSASLGLHSPGLTISLRMVPSAAVNAAERPPPSPCGSLPPDRSSKTRAVTSSSSAFATATADRRRVRVPPCSMRRMVRASRLASPASSSGVQPSSSRLRRIRSQFIRTIKSSTFLARKPFRPSPEPVSSFEQQ